MPLHFVCSMYETVFFSAEDTVYVLVGSNQADSRTKINYRIFQKLVSSDINS